MTIEEAKEILKDYIEEDGGLYGSWEYLDWNLEGKKVTLDGNFTVDELEAIAVYIRYKKMTGTQLKEENESK